MSINLFADFKTKQALPPPFVADEAPPPFQKYKKKEEFPRSVGDKRSAAQDTQKQRTAVQDTQKQQSLKLLLKSRRNNSLEVGASIGEPKRCTAALGRLPGRRGAWL